jgi:hypothetical protein
MIFPWECENLTESPPNRPCRDCVKTIIDFVKGVAAGITWRTDVKRGLLRRVINTSYRSSRFSRRLIVTGVETTFLVAPVG